jgi:hypothetical protein
MILFGGILQEEWTVYGAHLCKIVSLQFLSIRSENKGKSVFFYVDGLGSLSCSHSELRKGRPMFFN